MPAHIDYSSESEEEEMTPNKGSHVPCGSRGGEVKLSLCYSYRRAVGSFSGWTSAVIKTKENHSQSQNLIQGQTIFSVALVFTPFSNLEVYQDFATASTNLPAIHEAVATWLSLWAPHCHLAKPGRLHFLNCSSETKLAQPLLIILVILPLNCLHFVCLFSWQWPETKLTS